MQNYLGSARKPSAGGMGVGIAGKQTELEEHHAGVPHGRRPTQEGQEHLCRHRFHQEHEEGAEKQRNRVEWEESVHAA